MARTSLILLLAAAAASEARSALLLESAALRVRGGAAAEVPPQLADARAQLGQWWSSAKKQAAAAAPAAASDPDRAKAASLLRKRALRDCERAVELLRGSLGKTPDDAQVKLELADALNAVMRIKTNANALVIEGTLDTAANKKTWRVLGEEALPLAKAAYDELYPKDVKALAVYADSFMFLASSKGIVKQALTGTAKEYKRIANELRKHPNCDSAVGCVFLGGFFNVAPWPVGNKQLAKQYLTEAAQKFPGSRRNLYYCGVNAYQLGEYEAAKNWFNKALKAKCGSPTEEDFGDFLLSESRKGLQLCAAAATEAE